MRLENHKPPLFSRILVALIVIAIFLIIGTSLWNHELKTLSIIAILANLSAIVYYQTNPFKDMK